MTRLEADSGATYRLDPEPVAIGGEALVYRAIAEDDGAEVAVRVALIPGTLAAQCDRMERLAVHPECGPAMLGVWDRGTWEDREFHVLDWVPHPLDRQIATAPLPTRRAAVLALTGAVARLHRGGEAHGDLKPANVLLRDGDPLAPLLTDPRPSGAPGYTAGYAAPEQVRGGPASVPADRYALAATTWHVLTGALPDPTGADRDRFDREVGDPRLREVLERMMAPLPELRPDLGALERALQGEPADPSWAGPRLVAVAAVASAVLAVGVALSGRADRCPAGFSPRDGVCAHPDGRVVARIEPGRFPMGRQPGDDPERMPDADPHDVSLSRPFWLGTTEVTQARWSAVSGASPVADRRQLLDGGVDAPCATWHGHGLVGDDRPVVCVSFFDVVGWLNDLSRRDGLRPAYTLTPGPDGPQVAWDTTAGGWRLPTEAEWEWAARAGGAPADVCARANLRDQSAPEHWGGEAPCDDGDPVLAPVARRPPNRLGLFDLEGNALEWVWDRYGPYPAGSVRDPTGPGEGPARAARGASWNHVPRGIAARYAAEPAVYDYTTGFRIARTAPR